MSASFVAALEHLVDNGDYGQRTYELQKIKTRITYSKDRYILAPFSWKRVVESKAPALLFLGACNAVAGVRGRARIPDDPQHLLDALDTTSILRLMEEGVREEQEASRFCLPDQYAVELPNYYSKLRFPPDEAYVYKSEYWLQARNRESAIHVDHGRVVSYVPPCARDCFKIWVFFSPATEKIAHFNYVNKEDFFNRMLRTTGSGVLWRRPLPEQSGLSLDVIADRVGSFRYATKVASGAKRGSGKAWGSLLSAYCVMEGRDYDPDNFEKAKKRFYEKLQLPDKSSKARTSANAKKYKKRRRTDTLASVRAAKRASEGGALASVS
ncbi:hypothetical protein PC123_g9189 [Phytophthora cactorum]|nr:hypothetical protein PC120_g13686 [Phytophthora cactorum]KAG4055752.1 hypothetical protein PC123_g9189 [Phytophthora cactorum]